MARSFAALFEVRKSTLLEERFHATPGLRVLSRGLRRNRVRARDFPRRDREFPRACVKRARFAAGHRIVTSAWTLPLTVACQAAPGHGLMTPPLFEGRVAPTEEHLRLENGVTR
jgi:hypothetical protein